MSGETETTPETAEGLDVEYPEESWTGFFRQHFGPSVMWALIGIGASHIILAPTMGARYGIFAVWIVAFIYLVKWGGWELGIRYNYGTGKNPVEGYEELPGPERWGQWLTFFIYLFLWTNILGAVAGGASAFVNAFMTQTYNFTFQVVGGLSPVVHWYVVLVGIAGTLVFVSRYQWLENIMKLFIIGLAFLVILGLFISPPSGSTVADTVFAVPDVSSPIFLALFAGAAAYMPVGLSSSISIGSWSMAKNEGAELVANGEIDPEDPEYRDYVSSWMDVGLRDYNVAFAFSFVLIVSMILLATSVLYGTDNIPSGGAVPFAVGSLLNQSYGAWAFYAMMIGAVAALYSTVIGNIDATARVTSDILGMVREDVEDTEKWRKILVVVVSVFSIAPVLFIGNFPVTLVTFSAALIGVFQVFFYVANYWLVRENLDEEYQPGSVRKAYYFAGFVLIALFGLLGALNNFGIVGA